MLNAVLFYHGCFLFASKISTGQRNTHAHAQIELERDLNSRLCPSTFFPVFFLSFNQPMALLISVFFPVRYASIKRKNKQWSDDAPIEVESGGQRPNILLKRPTLRYRLSSRIKRDTTDSEPLLLLSSDETDFNCGDDDGKSSYRHRYSSV